MDDTARLMANFKFLKALTNRYGPDRSADLVILADRLVGDGVFASRREAVLAIEEQAGLPPTEALG